MNSEFNIAVHCLTLLSVKEDHMANSEEIAKSVCTHPARIRKVLGLLRKHGTWRQKKASAEGIC
ncbi:Transcriptional regulator [Paenibacillus sp. P1XP2]|nr:Transcriptional regulator [Paenibacillus sp. P1XP2]